MSAYVGSNILSDEEDAGSSRKKESEIRVGTEYQCEVPDSIEDDVPDRPSSPDTLLWNPKALPEDIVDYYLRSVGCRDAVDEEKALWLLHRCEYNVDEAVRRHSFMPPISQNNSSWSECERSCFERGYRIYGKNFSSIQKMIRSKSAEDIIEYYYLWKNKRLKKSTMNGNSCVPKEKQ
ncbi:unnamed protein product [Larinioides sclopetarius]|uniref:Mesoderm induction early response protein 2 n=1 Tax=Larinioides sclopetarius TaxID=280406 RepID=A0AAV1ZXH2_9ARAC